MLVLYTRPWLVLVYHVYIHIHTYIYIYTYVLININHRYHQILVLTIQLLVPNFHPRPDGQWDSWGKQEDLVVKSGEAVN